MVAESGWGLPRLEHVSPTAIHQDISIYHAARWTFGWGPAWDCEGSMYMET